MNDVLTAASSQHAQIPITLCIHWFSEEVSTLHEGRQGRSVQPFTLPVSLTPTPHGQGWNMTSAEPIFDQAFLQSVADAFAPVDPTPLLAKIARQVGSAVRAKLSERLAQGQAPEFALTQPVTIPLHLPILDRQSWRLRADLLPVLTITANGGALYVSGAGLSTCYQAVATLASTVQTDASAWREGIPLHFAHTVTASPDLLARLRTVLSTYGFGPDLTAYLDTLTGPAEVAFEVTLPSRFTSAWATAPGEAARGFLNAYRPVAHAVQRSLRRWLPILALPTLDDLANLEISPAVLTYAASRSYVGKSKTRLAYDILENVRIGEVYESARRSLPPVLSYVSETLLNAGFIASGRHFRLFRLPEFVASVRRDKRLFPGLLKLDSLVIDDLIHFAATAREVTERSQQEPQRAYGLALRMAERFGKRMLNRLSYLLPKTNLESLRTLLLLEATAALVGAHERRAVVTIGGRTFVSHPSSDAADRQCAA